MHTGWRKYEGHEHTDEVNPGKSPSCLLISLIKSLPIPKDALQKKGFWSFDVQKGLQVNIFLKFCTFSVHCYLCFLLWRRRSKLLLRDKLPWDVPCWNFSTGLYFQNETTKDRQLFISYGSVHGSYLHKACLPLLLSVSGFWLGFSILAATANKIYTAHKFF